MSDHDETEYQDVFFDSDDEDGIHNSEVNQFDILCDGVLENFAILHNALQDLLVFKDDLLENNLPPVVHFSLLTVAGSVFRSFSDLKQPISELIRLVRLYSQPWDEKSKALRKLHECFEKKCRQLDAALHRLSVMDSKCMRADRDHKLHNWSNLILNLLSARGHGTRWKFGLQRLTKARAAGAEGLAYYINGLDKLSANPLAQDYIHERTDRLSNTTSSSHSQSTSLVSEGAYSSTLSRSRSTSAQSKQTLSEVEAQRVIERTDTEVQTSDVARLERGISTEDTEYQWHLHLRIFTPVCSMMTSYHNMKVLIRFAGRLRKTKILDYKEIATAETDITDSATPKRRGLIGTSSTSRSSAKKTHKPSQQAQFDDITFPHVQRLRQGCWDPKAEATDNNRMQISLMHGENDETIGFGTVDLQELEVINLHTVTLSPQRSGSEFFLESEYSKDDRDNLSDKETYFEKADKINFPMYSSKTAGTIEMEVARLPVSLYWSRKPLPKTYERSVGTTEEVVFDDLNIETLRPHEDSMPVFPSEKECDLVDASVSPCFSKHEDDTDSKVSAIDQPDVNDIHAEEMNLLIKEHAGQLALLQAEYESRLKLLSEALAVAEQRSLKGPAHAVPRSKSGLRVDSPMSNVNRRNQTIKKQIEVARTDRRKFLQSRGLPMWGEGLPDDFLERLRMFNELSEQHRQQLTEERNQKVFEETERRLAAQYRISRRSEHIYSALKDVNIPALFMPSKSSVFDANARQSFYPAGTTRLRLTQPPSIFQLPPLKQQQQTMSVLNLFDVASRGTKNSLERPIVPQNGKNVQGIQSYNPELARKVIERQSHLTDICTKESSLLDNYFRHRIAWTPYHRLNSTITEET